MPLRARHVYRAKADVTIDDDAFEKVERSRSVNGNLEDSFEVTVPACSGCGRTIRDPKELAGHCFVCGRVVCLECTSVRCDIHRKIVCEDDAIHFGAYTVCRADSFLAVFSLMLLGTGRGRQ